MVSDYVVSIFVLCLLSKLYEEVFDIIFDILILSDVIFYDVENGKVDMVINCFENLL